MNAPTITRRQAWAKLMVAMADEGLTDPAEISFHDRGDMVHIKVDSAETLAAWAAHFGADIEAPFESNEPGRWIHGAATSFGSDGWNGFYLRLTAYVTGPTAAEPADEDLTALRALADQDITQAGEVAGASGVAPATAAPDDQVWTASIRQGLTYHAIDGGRTGCARSKRTGQVIGMAEAVALGGDPCKRCYPGEAS